VLPKTKIEIRRNFPELTYISKPAANHNYWKTYDTIPLAKTHSPSPL
jgi:hypothetical protein